MNLHRLTQEVVLQQATKAKERKSFGFDRVFWTPSGKSYHFYNECGYINGERTKEIFEGSVAQARELKNITDICNRCKNQAMKEKKMCTPTEAKELEEVVEILNLF